MEDVYYVYLYEYQDIPIYVGKGKGGRYTKHLKIASKIKSGKHPFYDKLKSILKNGEQPKITILYKDLSNEEALKLERFIELSIGTLKHGTGTLLNLNECGIPNPVLNGFENPMFGKSLYDVWSNKYGHDTAKLMILNYSKKIRDSLLGKKHKDETKSKMSESRSFWHANKTIEVELKRRSKISEGWDDTRKKEASNNLTILNKKRSGVNNHRSRKCSIDGIIYNTIKEVQLAFNFKNHNTVRHRLNSNNFPNWFYFED